MTPEETVNLEIWEVLQDIKEESLVPEEDGTIFYDTTKTVIAAGHPSPTLERKWAIVHKLSREKALKIIREIEPSWVGGRNGFYLKVLQPKFNEVYKRYQQACDLQSHLNTVQAKVYDNLNSKKGKDSDLPEFLHVKADKKTQDYEKKIDDWLNKKDSHALGRIWQVVEAINYERQLRDQDAFKIPYDKFQRTRINSREDLEAILTNLQNQRFLLVLKKVGETPPSTDPTKPQASLWATIVDKPEIINDPLTQIKLNTQRFEYLVIALKARVHPEKMQDQHDLKQPSQSVQILWSDKLQWQNSREFILGKKGSVNFGTDSSDRIKVFKMLTNTKGKWVTVKDMAKAIGTSEGQLRVIVGQINKEYLQPTIIEIVERNDKNELGAYRINIMIPLDKL